jgi:membrane-bound lytic murein transglycosylase D
VKNSNLKAEGKSRKNPKTRLLPLMVSAFLAAFCLSSGPLAAGETEDTPENPGPPLPREPSRPLRVRRFLTADHPAYRGDSPWSSAFRDEEGVSHAPLSLLSPGSLEKDLTRHYIRQYSTPQGLAWLDAVMDRGGPYLAFIRKEIEARGLPPELIYLPVVESQYLASALSRSGASGLWQFMKNSIGPFDMKVNDWMDERRDFWKSTQGALRKLEENYRHLDDWALALAAYNTGLGAVNRVIRSSGIRDYWLLSEKKLLRTETVHYVPKLLAVAHILSHSRRFGILPRWPQDPQWVRVAVDRSADLDILAAEAGMDADTLKSANRELAFNVTPPGGNYYLKVRAGDAEKVHAVLARKDLPLVKYYFHTIRSGDTLLALAHHYGITVAQILEANPGTQARYLKLGGRLLIPAFKDAEPFRNSAAQVQGLVFAGNHLVKKGETLWSLALAYEVDPEVLAEANGMGLNDILREGRSLKTPIK